MTIDGIISLCAKLCYARVRNAQFGWQMRSNHREFRPHRLSGYFTVIQKQLFILVVSAPPACCCENGVVQRGRV